MEEEKTNDGGPTGYGRETQHDTNAFWNSSGSKIWEQKMAPQGYSFENIGMPDLVGDNSIRLMSEFCQRCASSPPTTMNNKPYANGTVVATLGAVIRRLKAKFANEIANQPDMFPEDEVSKWKTKLKDSHNRTMMQGEDETDVLKNTFPIPREHGPRTRLFPFQDFDRADRRDASLQTDMTSLCKKLFSQNRYTELAKLTVTFNGIGRGGECKFLNYRSWYFCNKFNMLFVQWFQRKNLKTNPSAFVPDFENPENCVFLALGCYWSVDHGLEREDIGAPNSPEFRKSRYLFQDLHSMQDRSVTTQLSNTIQSLIVAQLKAFYSAKSLRIGAMTMLAWDPSITYEEAVALGGWATPSNRDWYTWIYLVAVIPPALALAGYPDARVIPYLPSTGCLFALGDDDEDKSMQVDKYLAFVSDLFSISLPEFKPPHGKLRRLLTTVVAVMIMHFDDLYKKYLHTNRYVARMIRACLNAKFARNKTDAISLLCFWSRKVKEDFQQSNIHGKNDRDTLRRRTIPDQLAKMNESVVKLLQAKFDFQQQIMELHNRTKVLESEVHSVRVLCQRVSEQNDNLLTAAKITQEQNKRIMLKLGIPVMVNSPGDAHLPPLQLLAATPTAPPAPTTAPVTQTQTPRRIIPFTEAVVRHAVPRRGDGTKGKSDKSESVANVLRDLYDALFQRNVDKRR